MVRPIPGPVRLLALETYVLGETSVVSPSQRAKIENGRRGDYSPAFPVRLMLKDTGLILRLAQTLAVPLPALAAAQQVYAIADASDPEEDFSGAVRAIERLAAIDPVRTATKAE